MPPVAPDHRPANLVPPPTSYAGTASEMMDRDAFVRANTALAPPPLVPEIRLHMATEVTPLWQATEATLRRANLPPPSWAFAWPGGQAVATWLWDRPERVAEIG